MSETVKPRASLINPRTITFATVIVAILVSSYLSYLKASNAHAVCIVGGRFDCGTVLNSVYSEFQGIPIAWLGLTVNIIVLITLILETRVGFVGEYAVPFLFGLLLAAFICKLL